MSLEMRAVLPEEFGSTNLTDEATDTMILIRALLERYGITDFKVVRTSNYTRS